MVYEPDDHLSLIFDIDGEYTVPDAHNLIIDLEDDDVISLDQYVNLEGLNTESFGNARIESEAWTINPSGFHAWYTGLAHIYNNARILKPGSIAAPGIGTARISNGTRTIKPTGLSSLRFGTTKIESTISVIRAPSINSLQFPSPRIAFKHRTVSTRQEKESTLYGKPLVAHGVRRVEMNSAQIMTRFGTSWASHSPRYIEPRGVFEYFPTNHRVGISRVVQMEGFDFLRFGTRIVPESQKVYPQGMSTLFGQSEIYNYVQHIKPKGFLSVGERADLRFGHIDIFNSDQYVNPFHDETSRAAGPLFPDIRQHVIANRNRSIQTHGAVSQVFGYQELTLGARVLYPEGIKSPVEQPSRSMVAHGIRHVRMEGIDAPYIRSWHVVWLNAALVKAQGQTLNVFGTARLENTRRIYRFISLGEQSLFGRSMISHAVRNVKIPTDYTIAPPVIPMPEVKLGVRYVEPRSIDSVRYGWPYVTERFSKILPRWVLADRIGEPSLRNVTPQIRMWQFDSSEFGHAYIGLYTRHLTVLALNSQAIGRAAIGERTQKVNLFNYGIAPPAISRLHKLESIGGEVLPARIEPVGLWKGNFETDPKKYHVITQNVLRPESKEQMTLFGRAAVTANTIRIEPGYWEILMGKPLVEHKNRIVRMNSEKCDFLGIGVPRMSPHTIWAVKDAPVQAIRNHVKPNMELHYVDGLNTRYTPPQKREPGIEIGTPVIAHKHRFISARAYTATLFGAVAVRNTSYFIAPKGLSFLRFGVIAPIGDQEVSFRSQQIYSLYGKPSVQHKDERDGRVKMTGLHSFAFGQTLIEHFHREVRPAGINSLAMGTRRENDRPYMWQGLRVGAHVPTRVGGDAHQIFGAAWISHRVREAIVLGLDFALVGEYTPGQFNLRMQIYNRNQPELPPAQRIVSKSFVASAFGVPNIKPAVHFIRPYGNSDHYRKGSPHA